MGGSKCAPQVKVRVRRGKSVKVRAADGGEHLRIRLRRDDTVQAGGQKAWFPWLRTNLWLIGEKMNPLKHKTRNATGKTKPTRKLLREADPGTRMKP